jgi:hypothetical protein
MEAVYSSEAFVTIYKTKPWYIQHTIFCLSHCLQEPAMDLVLIQLNPIHIVTLSAFQHAVLTRNIPCSLTISVIGININIDQSVLQPVRRGVSGLWNCWVCKWFLSQFRAFWAVFFNWKQILYSHSKSLPVYSLPAVCCHISRLRSPQSFIQKSKLLSLWYGRSWLQRQSTLCPHFVSNLTLALAGDTWDSSHTWKIVEMSPTAKQPESNFLTPFFVVSYFLVFSFMSIFMLLFYLLPFPFFLALFPFSFPAFISSSFYLIFSPSHYIFKDWTRT